jgi:hypothetical protein
MNKNNLFFIRLRTYASHIKGKTQTEGGEDNNSTKERGEVSYTKKFHYLY